MLVHVRVPGNRLCWASHLGAAAQPEGAGAAHAGLVSPVADVPLRVALGRRTLLVSSGDGRVRMLEQRAEAARVGGAPSRAPTLPADPSPLIGRASEIAALRDLLLRPDVRLVTLTGPAGTGKTRLAVAVARAALATFRDGAYFVDLAPLADADQLAGAIARALDVRELGKQAPLAAVQHVLADQVVLLVLDNFEHLVDAAPDVAALLDACPLLKVLATSREPLHLRWEQEAAVPPLAVPDLEHLPELDALEQVPAVELFVRRARALQPAFQLTAEDAPAIAELCVRLDGLPLAIELAAARTKLLPPRAILARLDERLDLLRTTARDAPRRHQALRQAIDWSYGLLSDDEQALFCRLGVFVGGCTLEAAMAVCDATLDQVASLVDKSLVRQEHDADGEVRLWLLETLRVYALEQLAARGEAEALQRCHAAFFVAFAEQAEPGLWSRDVGRWLVRVDREHANLRAALRRLLAWGEHEPAERLAAAVGIAWQASGRLAEGRAWLAELLAAPDSASRPWLRAKLLLAAGSLAIAHRDLAAVRTLSAEGLALGRGLGETAFIAWGLLSLAFPPLVAGDLAGARALLEEGVAVSRAGHHPGWEAFHLRQLGYMAAQGGDDAAARPLFERALELAGAAGFVRAMALAQLSLGWLHYRAGEHACAQASLEAAAAHWRELRELPSSASTASTLAGLGHLAVDRQDDALARSLLRELLAYAHPHGGSYILGLALEGLAHLAASQDQPATALRLAGAAARLDPTRGGRPSSRGNPMLERWLAPARATAGPRTASTAWRTGQAFTREEAVAAARAFLEADPDAARRAGPLDLTSRERDVAVLVAGGLTNRQIAERLVVGDRTVESHVRSALRKLGFRSRFQLAQWVIDQGLVPPPA
jgi:predicted ATPase/DNA-binding CsgD family transcriptional regulator